MTEAQGGRFAAGLPNRTGRCGEQYNVPSDLSFGLTMAVFFALVGVAPFVRRHEPPRLWALALAAVLGVLAVWAPGALHRANRLWAALGRGIQKLTQPVVLGALFFLVLTPVAWVARVCFGRDELGLKLKRNEGSYWVVRPRPGPEPKSMKLQF